MITRLLVANRAEIASRVFRTCRDLGIETVAVHSDADTDLPYVAEADHALRLPGTRPAETYLRTDLILEAARRSGADAIHPGYGFLSENADFARAVTDAGLTWIGPAPESIVSMGSKIESKKLMEAAGVPVLTNHTADSATESDLPLIVKASAGGGGRGMRIVRSLADLAAEIETATAEAESAFGDGTVFVEAYVERGRHVEVQVVGDGRGGVLVLGERDCSLQRRHQKVVEEAPAPRLPEATRTALHEAGRAAAAAIDYRGAGTVEFLYDAERDGFFFLEMNTRLQVEHPVTEAVHGVDLVALQIAVAEGGDLPGDVPVPRGHAIEVRLYAEDPAADYQPQSGLLTTFEIPTPDGVRVDTGFTSGSVVSTHYDAMLAKVIAHAPTRQEAARKLAGVLSRARIHGLVTNRDLLVEVLRDRVFLEGHVSTAFLTERSAATTPAPDPAAPVAAALALAERTRAARTVQQRLPVAWRNVPSQPQVTEFEGPGAEADDPVRVAWWGTRDGYVVDGHTVVAASPTAVTFETDGVRTTYDVTLSASAVDVDHPGGHLRLVPVPRFVDPADAVASGSLLAPMPGTVVKVAVEAGQQVRAGEVVLVLEAMKMQHTVTAPTAGTVTEINIQPGAQVAAGEVLAVVDAPAEGDPA
ncbi:MAG: biotin/lipoyl-binding protein [Nocardioides sp.]|uniref:acetyl/propionyl/methylcrotonyl-CoA carboxylase subunit alpha n=1 Tax=Nocardioides sp. TaxID=35761 RepID=UPI0023884D2B|nr:biotin carboxylase N-terminal domain-containing protein [Nocardioides sp.]MDE0774952.1 biotin/lipoyl-binding protein [Nocardioides sp.]